MFRFEYSADFLRWALMPPGWHADWHIGVRVEGSGKLVAFISGIPATMVNNETVVNMAEINFLCVHKKLRTKRLAPVLIKEITRRVNLKDIWQVGDSFHTLAARLSCCDRRVEVLQYSLSPIGSDSSRCIGKIESSWTIPGPRPHGDTTLRH